MIKEYYCSHQGGLSFSGSEEMKYNKGSRLSESPSREKIYKYQITVNKCFRGITAVI